MIRHIQHDIKLHADSHDWKQIIVKTVFSAEKKRTGRRNIITYYIYTIVQYIEK